MTMLITAYTDDDLKHQHNHWIGNWDLMYIYSYSIEVINQALTTVNMMSSDSAYLRTGCPNMLYLFIILHPHHMIILWVYAILGQIQWNICFVSFVSWISSYCSYLNNVRSIQVSIISVKFNPSMFSLEFILLSNLFPSFP